jgi:hypothetical protein
MHDYPMPPTGEKCLTDGEPQAALENQSFISVILLSPLFTSDTHYFAPLRLVVKIGTDFASRAWFPIEAI